MKDLIIIPTYDRPEMLWLCLEYLLACPEAKQMYIQIYVDAHVGLPVPRAEIGQVVERFLPYMQIQVVYQRPHTYSGNSFNLLTAYKDAYDWDVRRVYMVEDDVLVFPGFFKWHDACHQQPRVEVSIGVKKEPQHGPYVSLGVCFKRETLKLIVPHHKPTYFKDMRAYCRQTFPPSKWDCEQDGLWARVLQGHGIVWATEPVAQHVGWYGYHRPLSTRPQGTLEQRYAVVKRVLANPEVLQSFSRDFTDIHEVKVR